ncbi:MAG: ribonuclease HII [bacterium]
MVSIQSALLKLKIEMNAEELDRIQQMQIHERRHWRAGRELVAGVDEAGRGPLAGPVVAAAVIFRKHPDIPMVDDSKRLSEELRVYLFDIIVQEAIHFGIGVADVSEIDQLNILQASIVAMNRAVKNLGVTPDYLLVDGKSFHIDGIPYSTLVKGDSLSYSIAAASILAKVTRDRIMQDYDKRFPHYGFSRHKGYATPAHLDAIEQFGFCSIHRRSFHPKRFLDTQLMIFNNE